MDGPVPLPQDCAATLGTALIELINFARYDTVKFVIAVPVALGISLAFLIFLWRVLILGPTVKDREQFETKRQNSERER